MERIGRNHGQHIVDALQHATLHKYPSLAWLREASTSSAIEDRVRQLENVILRTIDSYQTLDFYDSHKQRLAMQAGLVVGPRMSISEHAFNENLQVPVGYYPAGIVQKP